MRLLNLILALVVAGCSGPDSARESEMTGEVTISTEPADCRYCEMGGKRMPCPYPMSEIECPTEASADYTPIPPLKTDRFGVDLELLAADVRYIRRRLDEAFPEPKTKQGLIGYGMSPALEDYIGDWFKEMGEKK